jgi:hypothetical protein
MRELRCAAALVETMQPHHWLEWLATCLVVFWVGQTMRLPPDNASLAVVDDGYVEGVDLVQVVEQLEGVHYPPR